MRLRNERCVWEDRCRQPRQCLRARQATSVGSNVRWQWKPQSIAERMRERGKGTAGKAPGTLCACAVLYMGGSCGGGNVVGDSPQCNAGDDNDGRTAQALPPPAMQAPSSNAGRRRAGRLSPCAAQHAVGCNQQPPVSEPPVSAPLVLRGLCAVGLLRGGLHWVCSM